VSATYALSNDFGGIASESDRRFKRLLLLLSIPAVIFGIIIPFIEITGILRPDLANPQRYAKLIKKIEEKKEEKKPEIKKPELTPEQKKDRAKMRAEKRIATLRDTLADLRASTLPTTNTPLTTNVITSQANTNTFASSATQGTQGIGEIGVVARGSTTGLGTRAGTSVKSGIGGGGDASRAGFSGNAKGRTLEEIQLVFDRNKGALYTMYVREQRQNPDMVGKLVVRLTIAPSGQVTKCSIVSSELHNPEFEKKVVARVLLMDFGAKDVGVFTVDFPIQFFPS